MAPPLRLVVWPGMPDVGGLEEAGRRIGRELDLTVISSNEDLEALLETEPPFDLITPSDYLVEKLAGAGRLSDLSAEFEGYRDRLSEWSRRPGWDPEERFSFPLAFGTTGLLHAVGRTGSLDSWSGFFDPGAEVSVGLLDELREVIGAALIAVGRSPNSSEEAALADATNLLERQRPAVRSVSSDDFTGPVERGEIAVHHAWSGPASMAVRRTPGLRYIVPREGALLWVTTAAIPVDAPDPEASRQLLVELLDPEIAAAAVVNGGYSTPSRLAQETLPDTLRTDEALFPDEETIRRCLTLTSLPPDEERRLETLWAGFRKPQAAARAVDSRI